MFFKSIVALAVAASSVLAQINTPASLVECVPSQLSWTATTAPYFLSIIPGGQSSAAALVDLGQQSGTTYTWTVNIASGTSVTIKLVDSAGQTYYSSPVTIQAGSSSACLTSSAAAGSTSSGSTAAAAASGASSAAATSAAASSAATSAAASSAASSAATTSKAATSAASAASSAASGASSKVSSAVSGASSAASSAAAAATSKSAAGKTIVGSFGAMVLGAIGIIMV